MFYNQFVASKTDSDGKKSDDYDITELSPGKDILLKVGVIVISGGICTGTSTLRDNLSMRYNIPKLGIGDLFRQKSGKPMTDHYVRPASEDYDLDSIQIDLLTNANPKEPVVLESRLGGLFASNIRKELKNAGQPAIPVITILLAADSKACAKRAYERDKKVKDNYTTEDAEEDMIRRHAKDLIQWHKAYPELGGTDPLSEEIRDMYDLVLDTTNIDSKEVVKRIHEQLLQKGAIEEVSIQTKPQDFDPQLHSSYTNPKNN